MEEARYSRESFGFVIQREMTIKPDFSFSKFDVCFQTYNNVSKIELPVTNYPW